MIIFSRAYCFPVYSSNLGKSPGAGLNRRPRPYQGRALPTELPGQMSAMAYSSVPPNAEVHAALRHQPSAIWSGKRDSNPRPRAWKARALPTELFPQTKWWRGKDSNLRRHRRQIYSLLPLATREPLLAPRNKFFATPTDQLAGAGDRT